MRISIVGILLLIMHALSTTLFQHLRIGDISPNFMIMIIVSFALLRGSKEGATIGLIAGLLNDISVGTILGPTAVIYGIIGYICGKFNKNFYRENFIIPFICTLGSSLFYSITIMLGFVLRGKVNFLFFFKSIVVPEIIYTITLSLVIYQIAYVINEKIEYQERKTRNIF